MSVEPDDGEHCQQCGRGYLDVYWLPEAWWAQITPKPEHPGAGLLCPDCALARLCGPESDAHAWGSSGGAAGWTVTDCTRCGLSVIGTTKPRDLLAVVWPKRFSCRALQRKRAHQRLIDREVVR